MLEQVVFRKKYPRTETRTDVVEFHIALSLIYDQRDFVIHVRNIPVSLWLKVIEKE